MHRSALLSPLLIAILLLGVGLRVAAFGLDTRFHSDEAYFAGFARRAVVQGDWLLSGDLDKPPVTIYALALALQFTAAQLTPAGVWDVPMRAGEVAARLPALLSGVVVMAVLTALTRTLYPQRQVGAWAALLAAASPLAIGFSAAAFTDSLMILAISLAALAAARGRPIYASIALAVGIGCKFQAVYALPLIVMIGIPRRQGLRLGAAALIGCLAVGVALALWDALRSGPPLFALAIAHNDPARLIRPDEVLPRLSQWLAYARGWFGSPTLLIIAGAAVMAISATVRRPNRERLMDLLLFTFVVGYFALHWLVAFNLYDRYLLPLIIPLIPLGARTLDASYRALARRLPTGEAAVAVGAVALTIITSAVSAARGAMPFDLVGSSFQRADGIDQLAAFIDAQPVGTIVYDHWLGWELGWYLDAWSDKRRVYYPTPADLAVGAVAQRDRARRLWIAPSDEPIGLWTAALAAAGFTIAPAYAAAGYVAYWVDPPSS